MNSSFSKDAVIKTFYLTKKEKFLYWKHMLVFGIFCMLFMELKISRFHVLWRFLSPLCVSFTHSSSHFILSISSVIFLLWNVFLVTFVCIFSSLKRVKTEALAWILLYYAARAFWQRRNNKRNENWVLLLNFGMNAVFITTEMMMMCNCLFKNNDV